MIVTIASVSFHWSAPIVRHIARCLASIGMLTILSGVLVAEIFDMDAIRNPSTLDVEVLQDWHPVEAVSYTHLTLPTNREV